MRNATPLWAVISVTAVTFVILLGTGLWAVSAGPSTPHLPHTVSAGADHEVVGGFDHPHLQADPSVAPPGELVSAVLPRSNPALVALALIGVACAAAIGCVCAASYPVRGPPRRVAVVMTGRQVVTTLGAFRR